MKRPTLDDLLESEFFTTDYGHSSTSSDMSVTENPITEEPVPGRNAISKDGDEPYKIVKV